MKATIEVDVKDGEALSLIRQTLSYMTGVDGYTLSFVDEHGMVWSNSNRVAVIDVPRPADSIAVALQRLIETLDAWAENVRHNNRDQNPGIWTGRVDGLREAAAEVRRLKKEVYS
jgi:hypothetical protein